MTVELSEVSQKLHDDQKISDVPLLIAVLTYLSFAILVLMGHLRDFLIKWKVLSADWKTVAKNDGFGPLLLDFESFFTRNLYQRIRDCWSRPIKGCASAEINIIKQKRDGLFKPLEMTHENQKVINMGSYNYLGFGEPLEICVDYVSKTIRKYGISTCSSINDYGYTKIHRKMERIVAEFVGKEDSICFPMGFATNSGNIQGLLDERCAIISDELNHASLILGSRLSGSKIFVFKHNDMTHLESVLRDVIVQGYGVGHRDWNKIIVIIEGIYSMEGTFIDLPTIVALKKRYKFYIYLDEAHSIGCTGKTGRGVVEFFNLDPKDIDIMMGTFTKSFGATGGYIAGDKNLIDFIRDRSFCTNYAPSMAPGVCAQIIASIKIISGRLAGDMGMNLISNLKRNIQYFRSSLKKMGFVVYGNDCSPVVPILIYIPGKIGAFSRMMLERNVAVVVVGFPATSILHSRVRFCISSAHTIPMLNHVLKSIDEVGTFLNMKYLN